MRTLDNRRLRSASKQPCVIRGNMVPRQRSHPSFPPSHSSFPPSHSSFPPSHPSFPRRRESSGVCRRPLAVIPALPSVIPALPSVIPAQAGIQWRLPKAFGRHSHSLIRHSRAGGNPVAFALSARVISKPTAYCLRSPALALHFRESAAVLRTGLLLACHALAPLIGAMVGCHLHLPQNHPQTTPLDGAFRLTTPIRRAGGCTRQPREARSACWQTIPVPQGPRCPFGPGLGHRRRLQERQ